MKILGTLNQKWPVSSANPAQDSPPCPNSIRRRHGGVEGGCAGATGGGWPVAAARHQAGTTAISRGDAFIFCDEIGHAQRARIRSLSRKSILRRRVFAPSHAGCGERSGAPHRMLESGNRSWPRANAKNPKPDGLIRNGEWRQIFSAEMIPPLLSLRSFAAIQFRSSG